MQFHDIKSRNHHSVSITNSIDITSWYSKRVRTSSCCSSSSSSFTSSVAYVAALIPYALNTLLVTHGITPQRSQVKLYLSLDLFEKSGA